MSHDEEVRLRPVQPLHDGRDLDPGRLIGVGGMGEVQEAHDRVLQRQLAMKTLRRESQAQAGPRARFIEEAQITAQLEHPYIIPVHELGEQPDGSLYFTMKLVGGETLHDAIRSHPLSSRSPRELLALLQVFLKLCDAVAFAHSRGVVHRDLKPENVMVGRFGQVYLMDWGIAKIVGRSEGRPLPTREVEARDAAALTAAGTALGTLAYMSPEQASGDSKRVDFRSDVFSLGAILYQILTQQAPYPDLPLAELLQRVDSCEITPPQDLVAVPLPPRLCVIAMRAMAKKPAERPQSAGALRDQVEHFLHSGWQFPQRSFAAGAVVVHEGSSGDRAYAIVSGSCEVYRGSDETPRILRQLGPGDVFGETAVFSEETRTATVRTLEPTTVLEISSQSFAEDLGMGPWLGLFVKALARRFAEKEERIEALERELAALRGE